MRKLSLELAEKLARRFLEPGDGVIEVGSATGEYALTYAERVGPTGEVLAVEPNRMTRTRGESITPPWVRWCSSAVGERACTMRFYAPKLHPKTASLYEANVRKATVSTVSVTTIDDLVLTMRQAPAMIQVDAQGSEAAIIAGAKRTLKLPAMWVIEIWPRGLAAADASAAAVLAPFLLAGYVPASPSGKALTWGQVDREVARVGPAPHGHFDVVLIPPDLQA